MLCRITNSNTKESFTVNDFLDLDEAKLCFPEDKNYTVEACNDIINYASYSRYVQDKISHIGTVWEDEVSFELALKKVITFNELSFEDDEVSIELPNDVELIYTFRYSTEFNQYYLEDLLSDSYI